MSSRLPPDLTRATRLGLLTVTALAALAMAGLFWPRPIAGQASAQRPNVVLILTDDMRLDGLWVMQNLLQVAGERGTIFNQFVVTTPLCCPSRATYLTGLYARNHLIRANNPPLGGYELFDPSSTIATWMQPAGIRTGIIGRYLNGYADESVQPGWNYWFVLQQAGGEYSNYYRYRATDQGQQRYYGSDAGSYSTRVLGAQIQKFLQADRGTPFMLQFTPRTPHDPATPDRLDSGAFEQYDYTLPPSYNEPDVSGKPSFIQSRPRFTDKQLEEIERFRRGQWASLLSIDRVFKQMVDTLTADGRIDNTWFIFTSDNGLMLGEHRKAEEKTCPYEECVHLPLVIIPPPGVTSIRTDDHLVGNIDIAPTMAAIMGVQPTTPVDGYSLLPLLSDPSTPWRDAIVLEAWSEANEAAGFQAVRTLDRTFVRYTGDEEELYDLTADPYQLRNRAADPAWAAEKARLEARLEALLAEPPHAP